MAYKIKYRVEFADLVNNKYRAEILQDNYSGSVTDLVPADDAFVIQYSSDELIYNPIRLAGASLNIVGFPDLSDLYSNNYQQYKINLYKNNIIDFTGYLYPEAFSVEHNGYLTEVEINCVSALSTLEYIELDTTADNGIITLFELFKRAVKASKGDYSNIYIPATFNNNNSLKDLSVSINNFIDEKDEVMKYKEILTEICKFYGWCLTEKNGNIYIIDVDYIKKGKTLYYRYDINFNESTVNLPVTKQLISDANSTGSDNNYSIIPSYTKITVLDSDYEIDNILFPELDLTNMQLLRHLDFEKTDKDGKLYKYLKDQYKDTTGTFQPINYTFSGSDFIPTTTIIDNNNKQSAGCIISDMADYQDTNKPNKLDYKQVFEIKQYDKDNTSNTMPARALIVGDIYFPVLKTLKKTPSIVFNPDYKLCLSFDVAWGNGPDGFLYDGSLRDSDKYTIDNDISVNSWYVPFSLRIGDKYYNSVSKSWQPSFVYFNAYLNLSKGQNTLNTWVNSRNTNDFTNGVPDLNGMIIHIDQVLYGDVELTVYLPRGFFGTKTSLYSFISNIKLDHQRININSKNTVKQDTLYSNIISDNYISEHPDIELKLTTKNESQLSLSKIIYNNNILDTITNFYTGGLEKPEKILINRVVNQYQNPKVKLTEETTPTYTPYQLVNLKSLSGKDFLIFSEVISCKYNSSQLTLIEVV